MLMLPALAILAVATIAHAQAFSVLYNFGTSAGVVDVISHQSHGAALPIASAAAPAGRGRVRSFSEQPDLQDVDGGSSRVNPKQNTERRHEIDPSAVRSGFS